MVTFGLLTYLVLQDVKACFPFPQPWNLEVSLLCQLEEAEEHLEPQVEVEHLEPLVGVEHQEP